MFRRFSTRRVAVYADFIDPFSYIGVFNLCRAGASRGIGMEWRGFEFNPDTPDEGYVLLTQLNSDVRAGMWASVEGFAKKSGVRMLEPQKAYNTARAQHLATQLPDGLEKSHFILSIFAAYFQLQEDISDRAVLARLLERFPVLAREGRKVLDETPDAEALAANRQEAETHQFAGLPGFIYKSQSRFGALSLDGWNTFFDHDSIPKEISHV